MKPLLLLLLLALLSTHTQAQRALPAQPPTITGQPATPVGRAPNYRRHHIDQMPVYTGGFEHLFHFIKANQIWPDSLRHIEGKVFVEFLIDTAGTVRWPRVLKGLHPQLDAEAIRLVGLLHFEPGRHNHKAVAVPFTVPVLFQQASLPAKRRLVRK